MLVTNLLTLKICFLYCAIGHNSILQGSLVIGIKTYVMLKCVAVLCKKEYMEPDVTKGLLIFCSLVNRYFNSVYSHSQMSCLIFLVDKLTFIKMLIKKCKYKICYDD